MKRRCNPKGKEKEHWASNRYIHLSYLQQKKNRGPIVLRMIWCPVSLSRGEDNAAKEGGQRGGTSKETTGAINQKIPRD